MLEAIGARWPALVPIQSSRPTWGTHRFSSEIVCIVQVLVLRPIEGFALERVAPVMVLARQPKDQGTEEVRGDKERPPALVLTHVDAFMRAAKFERCRIAAQHGV